MKNTSKMTQPIVQKVADSLDYNFAKASKVIRKPIVAIIHFEHSLLSLSDQEACFQYLATFGYGFAQVMVGTIAYLHTETRPGRYLAWPKL